MLAAANPPRGEPRARPVRPTSVSHRADADGGTWIVKGLDETRLEACHWLLLRLAGIAQDDLLVQSRRWLHEGRVLDVGRAVAYAALAQRLRLTDQDLDLLTELLAADGADSSALSLVDVTDIDPMPVFGFAPTQ